MSVVCAVRAVRSVVAVRATRVSVAVYAIHSVCFAPSLYTVGALSFALSSPLVYSIRIIIVVPHGRADCTDSTVVTAVAV